MLSNHRLKTVLQSHLPTALNEDGKQIRLAVRIVPLHKFRELSAHPRGTHVWWIRHDNVVFLAHHLRYLNKWQKLIQNLIRKHIQILIANFIKACIESREINWLHIQNRTVFLSIMQVRNERAYSSFQFLASACESVDHIRIKAVALHDGVDMRLDAA